LPEKNLGLQKPKGPTPLPVLSPACRESGTCRLSLARGEVELAVKEISAYIFQQPLWS
jgi:hypothetical protein